MSYSMSCHGIVYNMMTNNPYATHTQNALSYNVIEYTSPNTTSTTTNNNHNNNNNINNNTRSNNHTHSNTLS